MAVVLERFTVRFPDPDVPHVLAAAEGVEVRELRHDERSWAAAVLDERWGGVVAGHGELMTPITLPALRAYQLVGWHLTARGRAGSNGPGS